MLFFYKLLKKIYVNKGNVNIDSKALEEYGSNVRYDFLQDWLGGILPKREEDSNNKEIN